ncbi:MAG: hypothetical protein KatS3mg008_0707 [Acidimicrobiales bacterium]|nr:MAG: hypothetical protein KatS3mg008_0707 [Acidimicrobiales bacterium]
MRAWARPRFPRSLRQRLALAYACLFCSLATVVLAGMYVSVTGHLERRAATERPIPVNAESTPVTLVAVDSSVVQRDIRDVERALTAETTSRLREYTLVAFGIMVVTSLGAAWWLSGRILKPIERLNQLAREVKSGDLPERVPLVGAPEEVRDLVEALDDILERLGAATEAQRRFVAEASHGLRNPLAVVRTSTEVALRAPSVDRRQLEETLRVVEEASRRMAATVDALCRRARLDAAPGHVRILDLREVAMERVRSMGPSLACLHPASRPAAIRACPCHVATLVAHLAETVRAAGPDGRPSWYYTGTSGGWSSLAMSGEGEPPLLLREFDAGAGLSSETRDPDSETLESILDMLGCRVTIRRDRSTPWWLVLSFPRAEVPHDR